MPMIIKQNDFCDFQDCDRIIETTSRKSSQTTSQSRPISNCRSVRSQQQLSENCSRKSSIFKQEDSSRQKRKLSTASDFQNKKVLNILNGKQNCLVQHFITILQSRNNSISLLGISLKNLVQLYLARCSDMSICVNKLQLIRFYENFEKSNEERVQRYFNLQDLGLGDISMSVICKILSKNPNQFSRLNLSKNQFKDQGMKQLSQTLRNNTSIVHLNLSDNYVSPEGATELFQALINHQFITSIDLANRDCQKQRVKIGVRGALMLSQMLEQPHCLISHLDLSNNTLPIEAINSLLQGMGSCTSLLSLNLSQNNFESSSQDFLIKLIQENQSLVELILSKIGISDQFLKEMAKILSKCQNNSLKTIDLGENNLSIKGVLSLLECFENNGTQLKLQSIILDKNSLNAVTPPEFDSIQMLCRFNRAIYFCIKQSKLKLLSLANCKIDKSTLRSIGDGVKHTKHLMSLSLKDNLIFIQDLKSILEGCSQNLSLPLKHLDLSSNQLKDKSGQILFVALKDLKSLESLNLRDNQLESESAIHLKKLLEENHSITSIQVGLNMFRKDDYTEIEDLCKQNFRNKIRSEIPQIQWEIKKFKKIQQDFKQIDKFNQEKKLISEQIQTELKKVDYVEDLIEGERNCQKQELNLVKEQQKQNQQYMKDLDQQSREMDLNTREQKRDRIRDIESKEEKIKNQQWECELLKIELDKQKAYNESAKHIVIMNIEKEKLLKQLEKINKKKNMLEIINEGYVNEIEKTKNDQEVETQSPVKISINKKGYSVGIGGSPSKQSKRSNETKSGREKLVNRLQKII